VLTQQLDAAITALGDHPSAAEVNAVIDRTLSLSTTTPAQQLAALQTVSNERRISPAVVAVVLKTQRRIKDVSPNPSTYYRASFINANAGQVNGGVNQITTNQIDYSANVVAPTGSTNNGSGSGSGGGSGGSNGGAGSGSDYVAGR
jgi:hypothetical protein